MTLTHAAKKLSNRRTVHSLPMLHFLLIEDIESDALLIELELRNAGIVFTMERIETEADFVRAVQRERFDAIISDYHLPGFSALRALQLVKEMNIATPFVLVTGSQSEEIAVECIKQGADDYLLKQSLTRLPSALLNAINKRKAEQEKQQAINELRSSRESLRALSAHLQLIREQERTRIAREIHDELGQALTALKMDVLWIHGKLTAAGMMQAAEFDETIKSMTKLIDSTINAVRRIAADLRPGVLDDLGLVPAIEWQSQEFRNRTGIQTKFSSNINDATLSKEQSTTIFRILQESLTNVARHAQATKVYIRFEATDQLIQLTVSDNGRGIHHDEINSPKSLGLLGMKERAALLGGTIEITGGMGQGTQVTVLLPKVTETPSMTTP